MAKIAMRRKLRFLKAKGYTRLELDQALHLANKGAVVTAELPPPSAFEPQVAGRRNALRRLVTREERVEACRTFMTDARICPSTLAPRLRFLEAMGCSRDELKDAVRLMRATPDEAPAPRPNRGSPAPREPSAFAPDCGQISISCSGAFDQSCGPADAIDSEHGRVDAFDGGCSA